MSCVSRITLLARRRFIESKIMADADSPNTAADGLSLDPKQQKEFEKKLKNLPTKVSQNEGLVRKDKLQLQK